MLIHSETEMQSFGREYAKSLSAPAIIELVGDVGAGKTTFVRGLAEGLGVKTTLSSPSFTISRIYAGKNCTLTHYDFYRLEDPGLMAEDLAESIEDDCNVTVIEWGQSIADFLPDDRTVIEIKYIDENTRELTIK